MSDGAVAQQKEVFKFRLDRDNYAFREQWLDSPDAARYYGNRFSRYLRAVLEEYAAKTVYQREAIYFDPQMRLIRAAAANGELLRIRMKQAAALRCGPTASSATGRRRITIWWGFRVPTAPAGRKRSSTSGCPNHKA